MSMVCEAAQIDDLCISGLAPGRSPQSDRWVEQLRHSCETLTHASPALMTAISTTDRLDGQLGETAGLLELSRRIGEEYGLDSTPTIEGQFLTVRFRRRDLLAS